MCRSEGGHRTAAGRGRATRRPGCRHSQLGAQRTDGQADAASHAHTYHPLHGTHKLHEHPSARQGRKDEHERLGPEGRVYEQLGVAADAADQARPLGAAAPVDEKEHQAHGRRDEPSGHLAEGRAGERDPRPHPEHRDEADQAEEKVELAGEEVEVKVVGRRQDCGGERCLLARRHSGVTGTRACVKGSQSMTSSCEVTQVPLPSFSSAAVEAMTAISSDASVAMPRSR